MQDARDFITKGGSMLEVGVEYGARYVLTYPQPPLGEMNI